MNFDAILFDCDGVLVDSEAITNGVIADTLNAYGAQVSVDEAMQAFLGRSLRESADVVARLIGRMPPESFFTDFLRQRDAALAARVVPVAGMPAVIAAVQASNIPFAVASGADVHKMGITLGRCGLLAAFEAPTAYAACRIFGSDHVAHSKPAPDVYLYAAKALGVDPRRCAVVEDTPTGTRAGVAAGATVIAYAGAAHSDANALLAAGASVVIHDMAMLPRLLGL
jgi:HAD superfamily hydrolase (TIGR01509 family)